MAGDLFTPEVPLTGRFARVVLERGIDHPEGLTYSIPASMGDLRIGERVAAPLGRGNRPASGYVIEIVEGAAGLPDGAGRGIAPERIKPLLERAVWVASRGGRRVSAGPDRPPRFPESLIRLAAWIGQYYCCPIGMVLGSMLPAAVKRQTGTVMRRLVEPAGPGPFEPAARESRGARAVLQGLGGIGASDFPMDARELAARVGVKTVGPVMRLVERGVLREVVREEVRARDQFRWPEEAAGSGATAPELTAAQKHAADVAASMLGRFGVTLLRGVTGSGKTEVYLRVLGRVLEAGRCAIVLVPEISLTPQTAGRFVARFAGAGVAVLHSGHTSAQRNREWVRVAEGRARVVVGARSAVFAPFDAAAGAPLGLIVVDEEHDHSYKQDQLPRYHARDVALRRGQLEGCPVLLGSATPSLESWHNALPVERGGAGRFALAELPERVGGGVLPRVEIVDLAREQKERGLGDRHLHSIGPRLERAIADTLGLDRADGGRRSVSPALGSTAGSERAQAILLLNRRGFASYICCPDAGCGWIMTCRHCDVTVVYHKRRAVPGSGEPASGFVRCHHCLAEQRLPATCPVCAKKVNTFGFGTQRLEEELARKFPQLELGRSMLRLDGDTMLRAADYFDALERFRRGEVRLLLGTQMIAKGLDFPNVRLIGVINADTAINLPDFRAAERTFQLVSQVAGRAGRSAESGGLSRVIVQTFCPTEPAITLAAAHDYPAFAEAELALRAEAGLPPVGRMARIVCRDEDSEAALARGREVAAGCQAVAQRDPRLVVKGPMACPISRVAGQYRFAVELLAPSPGPIQALLAELRGVGLVRSDAHTAVDVDPVALL